MDKYNKSVQHQWFHHATWGDSKYKNEGIGEVLWHSLTEDGKVEVVNIKFGNKTYENVSVKHLNPTDESHHSHKRTGKELKKKKVKEGMIKLKNIIKEAYIDPDDAGKAINYALDDLKTQLKRARNPEKWAEKYHRSVPGVIDMMERLTSILGKMKWLN